MSVQAEAFCNSAERMLTAQGASEIDWRNGASRAYYAMYHLTMQHADKHIAPPAVYDGSNHKRLIQLYLDAGRKDARYLAIGYILKNARNIRNNADYECEIDFMRSDAFSVLEDYKKVQGNISL